MKVMVTSAFIVGEPQYFYNYIGTVCCAWKKLDLVTDWYVAYNTIRLNRRCVSDK